MTMPEAATAAPLDDLTLMADVADTLRHGIGVPVDSAAGPGPEVIESLRQAYKRVGVAANDNVLREGFAAFADGRFGYSPPRGPAAWLARAYVARGRWGPMVFALVLALAIGLGAYHLFYRPYREAQLVEAQRQLAEMLPAQMDTLYQQIFNETKVQSAADDAAQLRDRGKAAAGRGDRAGAERAVADLTSLRDTLSQAYTLEVADSDDAKPGFWTFPPNNSEATNYYIVVHAIDPQGNVLSLPVRSEDTGKIADVARWGLRVPQTVYDAVLADKADDGVIERKLVGIKQDGFVEIDYAIPVLGGALTQW
jgi:hypothetical protein